MPYLKYERNLDFEAAKEALRIYLGRDFGYINFNLLHTVKDEINADIWRLGKARAHDADSETEYDLTPRGAEWDMAIKLAGRPDFIGGFAHGDERFTEIELTVDGELLFPEEITEKREFSELIMTVRSIGYDPSKPSDEVLVHTKTFRVTDSGIATRQTVSWLGDYRVEVAYLAMMPPLKTLTESFFTDTLPEPKPTLGGYGNHGFATSATVYGKESGYRFRMSVPVYPELRASGDFLITDNSGCQYNKMYFTAIRGDEVHAGDVWESLTEYSIERY